MDLEAGTRLGRYVIVAPIGAGGMGQVYRARDEELDREVAIKVLPPDFTDDPERLRRFTQEAQSAGGLNHPNVLTVHDVGSHEGAPYLVSELLEGETLRERLATALPPRKACEYAAQVARGLAAAHGSGIVHRDLKPENLFLTRDDRVKILDFGLAKLVEEQIPGDADETVTMGSGGTEPGVILGTVGYMAPEQVRGESADYRADIFALGSVFYELLTGQRAFQGDSAVSAMNAILVEDPAEASSQSPGVTKSHDEVIRHCMEKSPDHRFQSAQDLAFQLELLSGATSSSSRLSGQALEGIESQRRGGLRPGLVVAGLLAVGVLGALAGWLANAAEPDSYVPPRSAPLTYSGSDWQAAVSPDGNTLAFISTRDGTARVWLKRLPAGDEVALTEGPDAYPRFSPDGSEILYAREGDLYRVPVLGGVARKVVEGAELGDWTPHGDRIVFARVDADGSSIFVMSADGSDERLVHRESNRSMVDLKWSPDGKRVATPLIHSGANVSDPKILVVDVESGEAEFVLATEGAGQPLAVAWAGPGQVLVYAQPENQSIISAQTMLIRHDLDSGESEQLLYIDGVSWNVDVLGAGEVVVGVDYMQSNLLEIELGSDSGERRWLSRGDSVDRQPVYSPDGQWLAFSTNRAGNLDIWVRNLETGEERRVTEHLATEWDPNFTPDGESLIFSSDREGHFEIWMAEADGRNPRRMTEDGYDAENGSVTPDGVWLVYNSAHPEGAGVWKRHLETGEMVQLAAGVTGLPEISPDGKYVLYVQSVGLGQGSVKVVETAEGTQVPFEIECRHSTAAAGTLAIGRARWVLDGRSIAFLCVDDEGRSGVYTQDFRPGEDTLSSRRFLAGVEDRYSESFGFSPDGQRMVLAALELRQSLLRVEQLPNIERPVN